MAIYKTFEGDMVDAICARFYTNVPLDQAITEVLAANEGLSALGAVLPEDLEIILPDIIAVDVEPTIQLWD